MSKDIEPSFTVCQLTTENNPCLFRELEPRKNTSDAGSSLCS